MTELEAEIIETINIPREDYQAMLEIVLAADDYCRRETDEAFEALKEAVLDHLRPSPIA